MEGNLHIAEAAQRLGVSSQYLRLLEWQGRIPPARRDLNGRVYSDFDIALLRSMGVGSRPPQVEAGGRGTRWIALALSSVRTTLLLLDRSAIPAPALGRSYLTATARKRRFPRPRAALTATRIASVRNSEEVRDVDHRPDKPSEMTYPAVL